MTPKIIIVEGPDECGKTTLAKKIAERYNGNYWRLTAGGNLEQAMSKYMENATENALINLQMGHTTVFDRHWPSNLIYGGVLDNQQPVDVDGAIAFAGEHRVLFIFCHRDNAVEVHEANKDPDHPYDREVYVEIEKGYHDARWMIEEALPGQVIGYHLDNFIDKPEQLEAFLEGLNTL